jgi:hypothetical protein
MAKENKMEEIKKGGEATFEIPEIKIQKVPQKLTKLVNLDTGDEDAEVVNNYQKFTAPTYDKKYGSKDHFEAALLKLATALVQPVSNQIDALLFRATQDSYQAGKLVAFATGNFLTPELRTKVVETVVNTSSTLAAEKSPVVFATWLAAYTNKEEFGGRKFSPEAIVKRKAHADKMLSIAQAAITPPSEEIEGF